MERVEPAGVEEGQMITQIVVDTLNRLDLLKRTLESIWTRTSSRYRLHVIDDASEEGNADYLREQYADGMIDSLTLRETRRGIPANWNEAAGTGDSPVVVYTNGDVLCPEVDPDWLARGLDALARFPDLGMVSLNDPLCTARHAWNVVARRDGVTITDRVPSFFLMIRRTLMQAITIPDVGGVLAGIPMVADYRKIDRAWSLAVRKRGYVVGYLTRTYCQHIGLRSVRTHKDLSAWASCRWTAGR